MDADGLYGLPLEQFVTERAGLARALRTAGDRDPATAVAAMRKPSVAAWAVNQLIRTQRPAVDALLRAGDGLRDAQADVLAGRGDARALRAAGEHVREVIDELIATARGLLSSSGHELSSATLERVSATLNAAALDDEARELVVAGRLERELRHVGLGSGAGTGAGSSGPAQLRQPAGSPGRAGSPRRAASPGRPGSPERAESGKPQEAQVQGDRHRASADEREARREVERTERAVRNAEQRRDHAADALQEAQAALRQAEAAAVVAVEAHRAAQGRVAGRGRR
ncbi:MAG TPA: hypothetical protein VIK04_19855 [Solirubrobacteraceae bacterium]